MKQRSVTAYVRQRRASPARPYKGKRRANAAHPYRACSDPGRRGDLWSPAGRFPEPARPAGEHSSPLQVRFKPRGCRGDLRSPAGVQSTPLQELTESIKCRGAARLYRMRPAFNQGAPAERFRRGAFCSLRWLPSASSLLTAECRGRCIPGSGPGPRPGRSACPCRYSGPSGARGHACTRPRRPGWRSAERRAAWRR